MKLLVDIGNTRTKAALSWAGNLKPIDYDLSIFDDYVISQLTYAAVGEQSRVDSLVEKAKRSDAEVVEVVTAAHAFGIKCAYEHYQTLGIDRWLAVLAVASVYPDQDVIVVDAGTATTVDFVSGDKVHLGGWIVPGLDLMTSSVTSQTQKVFDDDTTAFTYELGQSTPAALKSGCLAAQIGLVHQAVAYFNRDAPNAVLVIAGGTAPLLMAQLKALNPVHAPLIVFQGLDLF
ncbi:MAG: type III pantothenate kinase [Phenylobacterium sp.]|jgi:type III pantothenate kinase